MRTFFSCLNPLLPVRQRAKPKKNVRDHWDVPCWKEVRMEKKWWSDQSGLINGLYIVGWQKKTLILTIMSQKVRKWLVNGHYFTYFQMVYRILGLQKKTSWSNHHWLIPPLPSNGIYPSFGGNRHHRDSHICGRESLPIPINFCRNNQTSHELFGQKKNPRKHPYQEVFPRLVLGCSTECGTKESQQ